MELARGPVPEKGDPEHRGKVRVPFQGSENGRAGNAVKSIFQVDRHDHLIGSVAEVISHFIHDVLASLRVLGSELEALKHSREVVSDLFKG